LKTYEEFLTNPPKVFISYSWTNKEHKKRVLNLANQLCQNGVDVKIDVWNLREGQNKYKYMEQMVNDDSIEKVLMICDKAYKEKANERSGGVGNETTIISPEIYDDAEQTKFVPIIFERDQAGEPFLPTYLKSLYYFDLSDPDNEFEEYEKLLRSIYNRPEHIKQPLGKPPTHIFEEKASSLTKTISIVSRLKRSLRNGEPSAIGIFEEYLNEIIYILESDFVIEMSEPGINFDDLVIEKINEFLPYRDEYIDVINEIAKYSQEIKNYANLLHDFFEKLINLNKCYSERNNWDHNRFITWELFLYTVALFIKRRNWDAFDTTVNKRYFVVDTHHPTELHSFKIMCNSLDSINMDRNKRLNLHRKSLAVDELRDRANKVIPFNLIMQADLILFLRGMKISEPYRRWIPFTLVIERSAYSSNFEFFIRAEEKIIFDVLLKFIHHRDKNDLKETINQNPLDQHPRFDPFFDLYDLTNIKNLGTR